ncbi:MAG TPA: PIN domain-containing protein [Anaerolineaceae bacterium]|nr:PIN domain-containing protein [Anaerolineales bacterium]HIQ08044.1 PIN domain-containing protein [Anaerolineaceae bacterium]
MKAVFVDTSALYALLDADDRYHAAAAAAWRELLQDEGTVLFTSNYVMVETFALVQHRLGIPAVRALQQDLLPVMTVRWVDAEVHQAAVAALLAAGRRDLSLVDCVSFELMRRHGWDMALTFDSDFHDQGFRCIPGLD